MDIYDEHNIHGGFHKQRNFLLSKKKERVILLKILHVPS